LRKKYFFVKGKRASGFIQKEKGEEEMVDDNLFLFYCQVWECRQQKETRNNFMRGFLFVELIGKVFLLNKISFPSIF